MDVKIHNQYEVIKIKGLKAADTNPRTHSPAQIQKLAKAIQTYGFTNPILIDPENKIIAGHGRVEAALSLKMKEVPCIRIEGLTPAQQKALILADNRIAIDAGWDDDLLQSLLLEIQDDGFDLLETGFEQSELDDLLNKVDASRDLGDEEAVPEIGDAPVSQPGQIWVLGKHRLMCGDSTDAGSLALLCAGQPMDLWITDPPYNVAYEGKTKDALTIQNDSMDDTSFRAFLSAAYKAADSVMRPGAAFYIWHADSEGYNFRGAAHDIGWKIRQCLIWVKQTMVMGRQDYHWKHEPCLYGWKEGAAHLWATDRKQTTVLEFDRPSRNGEHPTMKPVPLFEYQICNNTRGGGHVLDSFGGSGTTLICCEKAGRIGYAMELDPLYCDVIIRRWQTYCGGQAVCESSGRTYEELRNEKAIG